jgi:hypothetical protein
MNAAFSGRASGALFSQSRTVIDNVPNVTLSPTGASNRDTRDVILSRPCSTATGWRVISGAAPDAAATVANATAAKTPAHLIGDMG